MALTRWGTAFLQLGALLLAIGILPVVVMETLFPGASMTVPILLSLSAAPLGGVCLVTGLVIWAIGAARR
ncbi:hypothetical protein SAMN04487974_103210 [Pelagibacterium luteolum]|uniref:Uncharacterized protein n=1 Tax=Pelagibacterium luteolum TaxID=440168 RepID=A0A1G7UR14_9HYPH|nr:hypothetical protein SAMN04487974_103210 [Pelagibacterium luteolum]